MLFGKELPACGTTGSLSFHLNTNDSVINFLFCVVLFWFVRCVLSCFVFYPCCCVISLSTLFIYCIELYYS